MTDVKKKQKETSSLGKVFYSLSALLLIYGVFDFAYVIVNSIKTVSTYIQLEQMSVGYAIVLILISVFDVLLKNLGLSAILFILTESREAKLAAKKNEAAKAAAEPEKPKRKRTKKTEAEADKKAENEKKDDAEGEKVKTTKRKKTAETTEKTE